jgi:hypothetical protein
VAAVVIAVALILAVILVPGALRSNSVSTNGPVTYSSALSRADRALDTFHGGPWSLVVVQGGYTGDLLVWLFTQAAYFGFQCNATFQPGYSDNTTTPLNTGGVAAGLASTWILVYTNGTAGALVAVMDGQAAVLATLTGTSCVPNLNAHNPVPMDVIDSSQATADLTQAYAPLLALDPDPTGILNLVTSDHGYPVNATWEVSLGNCSSNTDFTGDVNATTGEWLGSYFEVGSPCSEYAKVTDIFTALTFGSSPNITENATSLTFSIPVISESTGITWANLSSLLEQANGTTLPAAQIHTLLTSDWNLTANAPGGASIAWYDPATWSWSSEADTPIETGDSFTVVVTGNAASAQLLFELGGVGEYVGSDGWAL